MMSNLIKQYSRVILFLLLVALIPASAFSDSNQEYKNQFKLGIEYTNQGKYEDAIDAFKQVIRIKPDDEWGYYCLGNAYTGLGKYQEAVDAYKQAIRINPDKELAYDKLGIVYGLLGRYKEVVDAYKQVIRIKPYDAGAHDTLGLVYLLLDDKSSALKEYKILKDLDKERASALLNYINIYKNISSKNLLPHLEMK